MLEVLELVIKVLAQEKILSRRGYGERGLKLPGCISTSKIMNCPRKLACRGKQGGLPDSSLANNEAAKPELHFFSRRLQRQPAVSERRFEDCDRAWPLHCRAKGPSEHIQPVVSGMDAWVTSGG